MTISFKHYLGEDFCVLERVPEYAAKTGLAANSLAIIDLETTGLDYKKEKITEIGLIKVAYSDDHSALSVMDIYQEFNDPGVDISQQITRLTGITNEMVKDKAIDWKHVKALISDCKLIVCHNAAFDRKFLEQTPIGNVFKEKTFGCTKNDIDWKRREYGANKLDYLNWKLGYFYDAHRAINDCWATLNLLTQEQGAFSELIENTKDEHHVYAIGAPYAVKDILKQNGFFWNTGENGKPKAWFKTCKSNQELADTFLFIETEIDCKFQHHVIKSNRKYSSVE